MSKLRLHLDADSSKITLYRGLLARGHDVTRTPNEWIHFTADDNEQLLQATARGRCIVTFNVRDFCRLAKEYPNHAGIILSQQRQISKLLKALDRVLSETHAEDWVGTVRWLNDWMK